MDVVLRTPNGEAELSLGSGHEDVAVADLVERVTGRRPDQLVYVDGRAVPATTALGASGALSGSTISTVDDDSSPPADAVVEIVQIAGPGSGARVWLSPGRYRFGAGRRLAAPELALGPVDRSMFRVEVGSDGATVVVADGAALRIDGVQASPDRPVPWSDGLLDADGRVFSLGRTDPRSAFGVGHRLAGSGLDGTATFNRPPRPSPANDATPLAVPEHRGRRGAGASSRADRSALASFRSMAATRHRIDQARRREAHPDLAAAALMAVTTAPELWQRRPGHADAFQVPVGLADLDWAPELAQGEHAIAGAPAIISELGPTVLSPVTVDLMAERGIGVVGGIEFGRAVARGVMIESAVLHGPADLDMVVLSSPERGESWEWAKWLPHTRWSGGVRVFTATEEVSGWVAAVRRGWERPTSSAPLSHLTLVVVDDPSWWRDRTALLRPLLADDTLPLRFVALAAHTAEVPAVCSTIITEDGDRGAVVDRVRGRRRVHGVRAFLASEPLALDVARRLAPLDDPDIPLVAESPLPVRVPILDLLGLSDVTAGDIAERWARSERDVLRALVGVTEHGPLRLDLIADGPHLLIAGAADSGKSEFLRNVVAALAAEASPDAVNFLLADATPGSTFGACAALPHTVGVITELDAHLANRLVRCMRAEIRRREGVLADGSMTDVGPPSDSGTPRLVVVIDDFAPIASARPDLLPALIEVAERGALVGVHVVLATRHPAGIVDDRVRAAMRVRVALRLQDEGDSLAVIDSGAAAHLPLRVPGRAYARIGDTTTLFQAAYSAGTTTPGDPLEVTVEPFVITREFSPLERRLMRLAAAEPSRARTVAGASLDDVSVPTDLVRLVDAMRDADRDAHPDTQPDARRASRSTPCPEPLPAHLPSRPFLTAHPGDGVPYGLGDFVDEQRQEALWWSPGAHGGLAAYGAPDTGTSSLLVHLALGIAERSSADDVHVYAIDADRGRLAQLATLPHVGAVVTTAEPDRVARLVRHLAATLDERRRAATDARGEAEPTGQPDVVLMIDDVGALAHLLDGRSDLDGVGAELDRVVTSGPSVGMCVVVTATRSDAVPPSWLPHLPTRLVLRLPDPSDYASFDVDAADLPRFGPGRAIRSGDGVEVQLVAPPPSVSAAVREIGAEPARERPVRPIPPLPAAISIDEIIDATTRTDHSIGVPVGLDMHSGEPVRCVVALGENVFVTGEAGSGRQSVLAAFAHATRHSMPEAGVYAATARGGPLAMVDADHVAEADDVAAWVERVLTSSGPRIVLVDDAARWAGTALARLAATRDDHMIVVVAGRGVELRMHDHWSAPLQRFGHGVLLQPTPVDASVVRTVLGPRLPPFARHRGILVVDGVQTPILAVSSLADRDAAAGGGN